MILKSWSQTISVLKIFIIHKPKAFHDFIEAIHEYPDSTILEWHIQHNILITKNKNYILYNPMMFTDKNWTYGLVLFYINLYNEVLSIYT